LASRLQRRFRLLDLLQAALATLKLLGQLIAPLALAVLRVFLGVDALGLLQKLLHLRLELRLRFPHASIAHRLVLARIRAHLRPVHRMVPELYQPRLTA
jgi:hypothetical protein